MLGVPLSAVGLYPNTCTSVGISFLSGNVLCYLIIRGHFLNDTIQRKVSKVQSEGHEAESMEGDKPSCGIQDERTIIIILYS